LRADPESVVVGEEHLGVVAVGDGDGSAGNHGGEVEQGEAAGEEAVGLELLACKVEVGSIGHDCGGAARNGYAAGDGGGVGRGIEVDGESTLLEDGDAGGVASALGAAVEDVDGAAVEREVGVDGTVEAGVGGAVGDGNDAVDGKIVGLAIDGACWGGLVGVQLENAIERVGVANHREDDGVTLIDEDLVDIGEIEWVRLAGEIVDDSDLTGGLQGSVDVIEADRNGEGCGFVG